MSNTAVEFLENKIEKLVQSFQYDMYEIRDAVKKISNHEKDMGEKLLVLIQLQAAVKKLAG
jgi:hypothetical protein